MEKTSPRFRRGDTSPLQPRLVFAWYHHSGKEIWFTPEKLAAHRAALKAKREKEASELKEKPLRRGDTSPDHPRKIFHSYQYGRELWVTPKRFIEMKQSAAANDRRSLLKRRENPEFRRKEKAVTVAYWARQREAINEYARNRRAESIDARIAARLRARIRDAIVRQGAVKCTSTMELVGCSLKDFREHIASQFTDGMCWERIGEIDIDHILPCSMFQLDDPEQAALCFHFSNLRPMWAGPNRSKNDKVEVDGQIVRGRDIRKIIPFQVQAS